LNANPDLSQTGLRDFTFDDLEVRPWLRYLHRFHLCHLLLLLFFGQLQMTLTRRRGLPFRSGHRFMDDQRRTSKKLFND
jgi:hypothetical protein